MGTGTIENKSIYGGSFISNTISYKNSTIAEVRPKYAPNFQTNSNNSSQQRFESSSRINLNKPTWGNEKHNVISKTKSLITSDIDEKFAFTTYQKHTKAIFPVSSKMSPNRPSLELSTDKRRLKVSSYTTLYLICHKKSWLNSSI